MDLISRAFVSTLESNRDEMTEQTSLSVQNAFEVEETNERNPRTLADSREEMKELRSDSITKDMLSGQTGPESIIHELDGGHLWRICSLTQCLQSWDPSIWTTRNGVRFNCLKAWHKNTPFGYYCPVASVQDDLWSSTFVFNQIHKRPITSGQSTSKNH